MAMLSLTLLVCAVVAVWSGSCKVGDDCDERIVPPASLLQISQQAAKLAGQKKSNMKIALAGNVYYNPSARSTKEIQEWPVRIEGNNTIDHVLDTQLSRFWVQCSHNTFLRGAQYGSGTTKVDALSKALQARYRCVELDIWPSCWTDSSSSSFPLGTSTSSSSSVPDGGDLVLGHNKKACLKGTNTEKLDKFLEAIKSFLSTEDADSGAKKMPLILNIGNYVGSKKNEDKLASELESAFGERIVRASNDGVSIGDKPLKTFVSGARRIIIRSKLKEGSDSYKSLVAMVNGGDVTQSVSSNFWGNVPGELKELREAHPSLIIRYYPHAAFVMSGNFKSSKAFEYAQLVCINSQNPDESETKMLQKAFGDWSLDGYVPWGVEGFTRQIEDDASSSSSTSASFKTTSSSSST
jgi:hypothetical protein